MLNISVYAYFQELTELLNREYEAVLGKIRQQHENYVVKFSQKNGKFVNRLEEIGEVLSKFREWGRFGEIGMLGCVGERDQILQTLKIDNNNNNNGQYDQIVKVTPSTFNNKNNIAEIVIKAIDKNYKTSTPNAIISNNINAGKTPQAKTKKNSVHNAQIMKSYESVQLPASSTNSNSNNTNNNSNSNSNSNGNSNGNGNNSQNMKPMSKKPIRK